ncbi:MAG: hypothetical protein OSJ52_08425 [Lachnospiraceae bacterium]|nr:hypothetical protein [Lachnospiraceae bacterium]
MLFYLNLWEEEYLLTREHWIRAIHEKNWMEAEYCQRQYQEQTQCFHDLHRQFSLLIGTAYGWERYRNEEQPELKTLQKVWLKTLNQAWEITKKGYLLIEEKKEKQPEQMTFQEVFIKSLYLRIREEVGTDPEVFHGYFQVLRYLEQQVDARDRLLIYPQITNRVLKLSYKIPLTGSEQKAELQQLLDNCLEFLKIEGGFQQLPELFEEKIKRWKEEYEGELPPRLQKKTMEWKSMSEHIHWFYEEFQETYPQWSYSLFFNLDEVYCIHDVISGRRKGYGWDWGELADDVCSEKEVERIEKKQVNPRMSTFQGLAKKLRFPSGNGTLVNQVGDPMLCHVMWEISRQTMLYAQKEILAEEHQERVWEALHMTMPKKDPAELKEWAFTRQEAMILNMLAYSYDELGQQEEGIAWMELLRAYYEKQPFAIEHYIDNYELVLHNLGNLYGNIGEYEKAMEAGRIAIRLALRTSRGDVLHRTLYDYGWNMEHLWEKDGCTKEKSRLCIEAALDFARFYEIQKGVNHFERHLVEIYGED